MPALGLIWVLVNLIPQISARVRRTHDTDRSGWWLWLLVVPALPIFILEDQLPETVQYALLTAFLLAMIMLSVWFVSRGTVGSNRFGEDPFGPYDADVFD